MIKDICVKVMIKMQFWSTITFIEIFESTLKISPLLTLLKKSCPMKMTPPSRSFSQVVVAASLKRKSIAIGGANAHPPHSDVFIEDVGEAHSSPTVSTKAEANGHGAQFPPDCQLL